MGGLKCSALQTSDAGSGTWVLLAEGPAGNAASAALFPAHCVRWGN